MISVVKSCNSEHPPCSVGSQRAVLDQWGWEARTERYSSHCEIRAGEGCGAAALWVRWV